MAMLMNIPKHVRDVGAIALLSGLLVLACSDDEANPLSARERQLIGEWRLDMGDVDEGDFAFTYRFDEDHTVRNRMGGGFLQHLRDLAQSEGVDMQELANAALVDGGRVTWLGTWSVAGDTLRVFFDELLVEVSGRLPLVGRTHVPVHASQLSESQETEIAFAYEVSGENLILRGESITAGVDLNGLSSEGAPGLGGLGAQALSAAGEVILGAFQGSDLNTFTFLKN